jgi:hypothetical protein
MPRAYFGEPPVLRVHPIGNHHTDRPLKVGSTHLDVAPVQAGDRLRVWMSVLVVEACTDQGDQGVDRIEERRQGRPRTVVRHEHDLSAEPANVALQEVGLRLDLDIASDQDASIAVMNARDDRGLVQFTPSPAVRTPGWGMQDLEVQVTDDGAIADLWGADGDAAFARHIEQFLHVRDGGRHRVEPHGVDPDRSQDVRNTSDVVEVGVGHDDQVEVAAAVRPKPPGSGVVFAGIDQDPSGRGLDQEGIALSHVDRGDREVVRSQSAHHDRKSSGDQAGERDGDRQPGGPRSPGGEQPDTATEERRHGGRSREFCRAAHTGEGVGGPQHHASRQPSDREQRRAQVHMDERQHRPGEGQHGRECRCWHRDDVGWDGGHRDLAERHEQQRNHGDLRPDRDGGHIGQPSRHPW